MNTAIENPIEILALNPEATVDDIRNLIQSHNFAAEPSLKVIEANSFDISINGNYRITSTIKTERLTLNIEDSNKHNIAYARILEAIR